MSLSYLALLRHRVGSRRARLCLRTLLATTSPPHTLCGGGMWHRKNNTLLQERVTMTTWQRCDYTPCVTPDTDHLKRKASWKENRKNHDSAGAKEPEQRQQRLGHTTGLTDCFRRDLVVRNSLNGNLLLNKENRENLESAGELPETDSRMYQTLKRMCHNTKTPQYCVTHYGIITDYLLWIFQINRNCGKAGKNRPYHWIERKQ